MRNMLSDAVNQLMVEGMIVSVWNLSVRITKIDVFPGNTSYLSDNRVTASSLYQFSLDTQSITPAELEKAHLEV